MFPGPSVTLQSLTPPWNRPCRVSAWSSRGRSTATRSQVQNCWILTSGTEQLLPSLPTPFSGNLHHSVLVLRQIISRDNGGIGRSQPGSGPVTRSRSFQSFLLGAFSRYGTLYFKTRSTTRVFATQTFQANLVLRRPAWFLRKSPALMLHIYVEDTYACPPLRPDGAEDVVEEYSFMLRYQ